MNYKNDSTIIDKCKLIFIGSKDTGKTSIFKQFLYKRFNESERPTYTGAMHKKLFQVTEKKYIEVEIWDTAGTETMRAVNKIYYKGANIVLMVYDVTSYKTFQDIKEYWLNEIKLHCVDNAIFGLAGNKSDLIEKRSVNEEEVLVFAKENDMIFKSTSALENKGIDELMNEVVDSYYEKITKQGKSLYKDRKDFTRLIDFEQKEDKPCC